MKNTDKVIDKATDKSTDKALDNFIKKFLKLPPLFTTKQFKDWKRGVEKTTEELRKAEKVSEELNKLEIKFKKVLKNLDIETEFCINLTFPVKKGGE